MLSKFAAQGASGCLTWSHMRPNQADSIWVIGGQEPPSAALAADMTSVASAGKTAGASRATTSVAAAEKTPDISISSTTSWEARLPTAVLVQQ